MEKGFDYKKPFVTGKETRNETTELFVFSAKKNKQITSKDVEKFQKAKYRTFDEFSEGVFLIWKITLPQDAKDWMRGTCTCPSFDEHYMCKHIIGIAHQLGALQDTRAKPNYDDLPLHSSKKGRPKKASEALRID